MRGFQLLQGALKPNGSKGFFTTSWRPKGPVATYEEVKEIPNQEGKVLIDVRSHQDVRGIYKIHFAINIPGKD